MTRTNYDRIISKSPEELAEWLDNNTYQFPMFKDWLTWLREETAKSTKTNADSIRAMTDEELAAFITGTDMCELLCGPGPRYCKSRCEEKCLEWLKKEKQENGITNDAENSGSCKSSEP